MLVRTLLQTSLVLWLAQQTLQGGVRPQSVSWGRVLPARGVGVGVKPGVAGALGAVGNRYGNKAMKAGIGRYAGAQLGLGGYRALGLGGRTGLRHGAYGTHGAYGASLGTGIGLGAGLNPGLGLGLGQAGKRVYGAGLGTVPGYGALAGIGYGGPRPGVLPRYPNRQVAKHRKPGVSAAGLGGAEMASLGQPVRDLRTGKSRALGHSYGKQDRTFGPGLPITGRSNIQGPRAPVIHTGVEVKSPEPVARSSNLGVTTPLDKQSKLLNLAQSQAQGGVSNEHAVSKSIGTVIHEATLVAGGPRRQLPVDIDKIKGLGLASPQVQTARDPYLAIQQNQRKPNCGSSGGLSGVPEINRYELLGSETQRTPSLVPQPQVGTENHFERTIQQKQLEKSYQLPLSEDARGLLYPPRQDQGPSFLPTVSDRKGVKELVPEDSDGLGGRWTATMENHPQASANLQTDGGQLLRPMIPSASGSQSLGLTSVEGQEAQSLIVDGQDAKQLSRAEHDLKKSKALPIPGQIGRNNQGTSYIGGAGQYLGTGLGGLGAGLGPGLGAGLGAGGYGAALGQGAYLGGAAGKLGAADVLGQGYGDGVTGYLGGMAGNSLGYGNGYNDGYGAGLGYPAELAAGAENKAGKSEALSTGGFAGQDQGAYGALGTGLESAGGKYAGGAAQVPYGNAPVIPAGLEGDGGYPYAAQPLSLTAEGAKSANKYGTGTGLGAQTGYGAQLGAAQEALGEQTGKYGGVTGALGNTYKG